MLALTNCSNPHASCNPHAYVFCKGIVPPPRASPTAGPAPQPLLLAALQPGHRMVAPRPAHQGLVLREEMALACFLSPLRSDSDREEVAVWQNGLLPHLVLSRGASRLHTGNRTTYTCPSHMMHRTRRHHGLTYPWPQQHTHTHTHTHTVTHTSKVEVCGVATLATQTRAAAHHALGPEDRLCA